MQLNFKIQNEHIQWVDAEIKPVNKSVNYLTAAFDFDDVWDGVTVTAVFCGRNNIPFGVLLDGITNICVIPWEALQSDVLRVSVYGLRESEGRTVRITSTAVELRLDRSGPVQGAEPATPDFTSWEQLIAKINDIEAGVAPDGSIGEEKLNEALRKIITHKADSQTDFGGFIGGENAAVEWDGAAVGKEAEVTKSDNKYGRGFAGGYRAKSKNGGASGSLSNTFNGGAAGNAAYSYNGGAVGSGAKTTNGFAGGEDAVCENNSGIIDAVQLGTGKNDSAKTFQVYDYRMMNTDGTIPDARIPKLSQKADKTEVDTKIAEAKSIIPKRYLVTELPTENIDTNGTYLVPSETPNENNLYTEYAYINGAWEVIGSPFEVDLSNYYTKAETDDEINRKYMELSNVLDSTQIDVTLLRGRVEALEDDSDTFKDDVNTRLDNKLDKTRVEDIVNIGETEIELELTNNTETRVIDDLSSLTITIPSDAQPDFISSIVFSTTDTVLNFTYPNEIKMLGEDCSDGVFTPEANKRYNIIISYDGANYVGVVGGYDV